MKQLMVVWGILVIAAAAYSEIVLQPGPEEGKDAFVTGHYPDTNFGADSYLYIGPNPDVGGSRSYFYYSIPLDDTVDIISAYLELHVIDEGGHSWDYFAFLCNSGWDEMQITWDHDPYIENDSVYGESEIFDITKFVTDWVTNLYGNFGFGIMCYSSEAWRQYASSDHPNPDWWPKLTITYTGTPVEETSWGEIKADGE